MNVSPQAKRERILIPSLPGIVRLVRLSNSVPASMLVLLGAFLVVGWPLPRAAWQAASAMWFVTAFGYASNDYFDRAEDAINKPGRPLPSGTISPGRVRTLSIGLAGAALIATLPLGGLPTLVAFIVLTLLTLYNVRLKSTAGGGNLLIAGLAGCTLFVGSVAVLGLTADALIPLVLPALVLTAFVATREVLKTMEDVDGDRAVGKQTVATRWGLASAAQVVSGLALLTVVLTWLPYWWQGYSLAYLVAVSLGVSLPLLYTVGHLQHNPSPARATHCLALLKASYFGGLCALLLA